MRNTQIKKTFQFATAVLFGLCSLSALAESVLSIGDNVVVTKIDGQSISNGLLSNPVRQFKLPAGNHTITAKYQRLYDLTADDHDIVRSPELTLSAVMQDGQRYRIVMANQPEDYDSAVAYAQKPTLSLLQGNTVVTDKTAITGSTGGLLGGIGQIFTGSGKGDAVTVNTTAKQPVQPVTNKASSSTLDQFMRVWLNATPAERIKIKNWVKDQ